MTYLLAISSILSRLIGVYRNFLLATTFGAGMLTDAYFAAFQIPDTLYRLFVYGAISAAFVPLFLREKKHDEIKAWEFLSSVMNMFLIVVGIISVLIIFFASPITRLLYPEFSPELLSTTSRLLQLLMIAPVLFTFSSVLAGIQNAFRSFWGFALAPMVYNIGIIFGILVLSKTSGITGVVYGVILGSILHALVQLYPCIMLGFRWRPVMVMSASFKELFVTAIPRFFSTAGGQIIFFIEGLIATSLALGDLTILRFAQDISAFPIGVIGISMALSSFSVLSHFALEEKISEMALYLSDKLDHLMMLLIPSSFGLYILSEPFVRLTLQGGSFNEADVLVTIDVLQYLCLGITFWAIIAFLSRVFFSFHDTKWPFLVILSSVLLNTLLAISLSGSMGVSGIALASSITAVFSCVLLGLILRVKHLKTFPFFSCRNFISFLFSSVLMTIGLSNILSFIDLSGPWLEVLLQTLLLVIVGAGMYFTILFLFLQKKMITLMRGLHH